MQKPVIQQFREAVKYLKDTGIAASNIEIGNVIGVKGSHITEILKERTLLKADQIQKFCIHYPVNPLFLLGFSDQIQANTPMPQESFSEFLEDRETYSPTHSGQKVTPKTIKNITPTVTPTTIYQQLLEEKDKVIATQEKAIKALEETVSLLRQKCLEKK